MPNLYSIWRAAEILLRVLRIFGEEKLFARDLEGYQEYLEKVS